MRHTTQEMKLESNPAIRGLGSDINPPSHTITYFYVAIRIRVKRSKVEQIFTMHGLEHGISKLYCMDPELQAFTSIYF